MLLTKEYLQAELAKLQQQHAQLIAQANATSGAAEMLTVLIAKCDEADATA